MSVRCHVIISLKMKRHYSEILAIKFIDSDTLQIHFYSQCRPQTLIPLWCAPWQLPGHGLHSTPWSPAHHPPASSTTETAWFAIKRDKQLVQKLLIGGYLGTSKMISALHLDSLVEVQRHHFLHAVLDHLWGEEVGFSLFVDGDLPEVLQQNGADRLCGMSHVDGSIIAHHLTHVGQSSTVVQVEMTARGADVAMLIHWIVHLYHLFIVKREKGQYIL